MTSRGTEALVPTGIRAGACEVQAAGPRCTDTEAVDATESGIIRFGTDTEAVDATESGIIRFGTDTDACVAGKGGIVR